MVQNAAAHNQVTLSRLGRGYFPSHALNKSYTADIDIARTVRLADPTLIQAEHPADKSPYTHLHNAPLNFAHTRGATRSMIRESRK
jgi:hypothetical protein